MLSIKMILTNRNMSNSGVCLKKMLLFRSENIYAYKSTSRLTPMVAYPMRTYQNGNGGNSNRWNGNGNNGGSDSDNGNGYGFKRNSGSNYESNFNGNGNGNGYNTNFQQRGAGGGYGNEYDLPRFNHRGAKVIPKSIPIVNEELRQMLLIDIAPA